MKKTMMRFLCLMVCCLYVSGISAQAGRDETDSDRISISGAAELPLTRIAVFSSGIAYFEHSGTLNGPGAINLPFKTNAVNDALMSLVLNDPASANPSVSYQSENTLFQTLRSLRIDISDSPDMANLLGRLRGEEVEISVPTPVSGKILGVEYRSQEISTTHVPWLSLYTEHGIRSFNFMDITSLTFRDRRLSEDLSRALDLIAASRNFNTRNLTVNLPGSGSRRVSLSYVIPAPVWKVSYRLDLGQSSPLFQGWAIIDNDSDTDWNNVRLSLIAGRPASFMQNLYPPYYVSRPTLPLAIAGTAAGAAHETGYGAPQAMMVPPEPAPTAARARAMAPEAEMMIMRDMNVEETDSWAGTGYNQAGVTGGVVETAAATAAGDQFEFTIRTPVSLNRRMSAMLPLVESPIEARKLLIFSGANAVGRNQNPRLGAELTNTSGMKLPAGPITVYDGGTYAGDALIEFWNEGEKRLVSYGEDLSVTGTVMDVNSRSTVSVTVSGGVMTFNRSQEITRTYVFKNNAMQEKELVIEHPKNQNYTLVSPAAAEETPTLYRFNVTLPAENEISAIVLESRPVTERITLLQLRQDAFLSYASSQEIPPQIREALTQAANLRTAVTAAETAVTEAERQRTGFVSEQDRIRRNIEAAGNQSQQGQEYLSRLLQLDASIDALVPELERLRANVRTAQQAYEEYIRNLNL
ncbi:MAG: DUF4139 domain-containing protein [Treponema sp.]|nr:DUF4139 domain-containing protein [Treponema sp.]